MENSFERVDLVRQRQSFEGRAPSGGDCEGGEGPGLTLLRVEIRCTLGHGIGGCRVISCHVGEAAELAGTSRRSWSCACNRSATACTPGTDAFNLHGTWRIPGSRSPRTSTAPAVRHKTLRCRLAHRHARAGKRLGIGRDGFTGDVALDIVRQVLSAAVAVFLAMCHRLCADGVERLGNIRLELHGRDRRLMLCQLHHF